MSKTEAAEILANDVRVWCRHNDRTPTKELVEERISELRGPNYALTLKAQAAHIATVQTTLRAALKEWGK